MSFSFNFNSWTHAWRSSRVVRLFRIFLNNPTRTEYRIPVTVILVPCREQLMRIHFMKCLSICTLMLLQSFGRPYCFANLCNFLLVCFPSSLPKCWFLPFSTFPSILWQTGHFAVSHDDFILLYSPTSRAPEACLQCLDFLVPSGHLRAMFMKAAVLLVPRPNTQPMLRTRQLCVSRNTIQGLTRSVPTWTWTYGLQQPTEMQISHFQGTRVTVEMCERNLIWKCE